MTAAVTAWASLVLPVVPNCVLAGQTVLVLSLFARAGTTTGRVRLRLTLLGTSAIGGTAREAVLGLSLSSAAAARHTRLEYGMVVAAAVTLTAVTAVGGVVMVAQSRDGTLRWARRLLDGAMVAGSLFTVGWAVLWHRAHVGDNVLLDTSAVAFFVAEFLVLGLMVSLWFAVRRAERCAITVAIAGVLLMVVGDALYLWSTGQPVSGSGWESQQCRMAGLLLAAASPWIPGGGSLLEAARKEPAVPGVIAALVPLTICVTSAVVEVLAWNRLDLVTLVVSASVLVALGVRQGVTQADNLRLIREVAAREAHFRFLVQESRDAIMIADQDGVLRYVSPAVRDVLGHRHEDLVGASLVQLTHPDDRTPLTRAARGPGDADRSRPGAVEHVSCRMRAADGNWRHIESAVSAHAEGIILSSRDVSERVALQSRLERLAFHDALTGLPNRAHFVDRVNLALRMRPAADPPTLLFVDLDGFKGVNDTAGHAAGDEVLVQAALRLQGALRAGDTVARLGGDEFAVLLGECGGSRESQAWGIAERVLGELSQPYPIAQTGTTVTIAASIGIAAAGPDSTAEELLRDADLAMYRAKAAGKGRVTASQRDAAALPAVRP